MIKPLLYRSIKLTKKYQRTSLASMRKEDSNLVENVSIEGNDSVWEYGGDFGNHFEGEGEGKCELGAGCVKDVFEEKYFKLDCEHSSLLNAYSSLKELWKAAQLFDLSTSRTFTKTRRSNYKSSLSHLKSCRTFQPSQF